MISAAASEPSRPQVAMSRAARETGDEAGGEHVARAGRVDELRDREGRRLPGLVALDDDAALFGARHDAEHALGAQRVERFVEMRRLVERQDLVGIGEDVSTIFERMRSMNSPRNRSTQNESESVSATRAPASRAIAPAFWNAALAAGRSHI